MYKHQNLGVPHVVSAGISIWDPVWAMQDHVDTHDELIYVVRGFFTLRIGNRAFAGGPGSVFIVPSGIRHRDDFSETGKFKALLIQFSWLQLRRYSRVKDNARYISLPQSERMAVKGMVLDLFRTFCDGGPYTRERVDATLLWIILSLAAAVHNRADSTAVSGNGKHRKARIEFVKKYIAEHISSPVTLVALAKHAGISTYYLSHLFSTESGFTLTEYITRARMVRAAELLTKSELRVQDVAAQVGYTDANYFGKAFRRYHHLSPAAFRLRFGEKHK